MEALTDLLNSPFTRWVIILLLLALIVPLYRFIRHRRQGSTWPDFAAQHGLTFNPDANTITGQRSGKSVLIEVFYTSDSSSGQRTSWPMTRAALTVANPTQGYLNASIGRGIASNQLEEANRFAEKRGMNMHYVHTGDSDIDRKVAISAPSGEFAARVLVSSDAVRAAILDRGTSGTLILEGQALRFEWSGIETKAEKLQSALDLLSSVADAVERA